VRAFVTGATGFVGSAVVRHLLSRGATVRVLARRNSDLSNIAGLDVEVAHGDLLDEPGLVFALRGSDTLFHVAAFYSTSEADSQRMYEVNVRGTKTVLRAAQAAGVARIVHTSTIGTIGQPRDGTLATEEMPFNLWDTASHYAKSKYLAEVAALTACQHGAPVLIVNPCAPVGARDIKPSSTGQRILDYLHGKQPSFVAGGINFISVEDVAEGHVLAALKGRVGQRYILGQREGNLRLPDFLALMERVSGVPRPAASGRAPLRPRLGLGRLLRRPRQNAAGGDTRPAALTGDPFKAIRELDLPQTPLVVAFGEAVAWFRTNGYVAAR
jgi:dihydroflavonol-4-reductase